MFEAELRIDCRFIQILGILSNSELYDLSTGVCQEVGHLNMQKLGLTIVVLKDRILAMGGCGNGDPVSSVEEFSLSTLTWSNTDDLLLPRCHHAVTTVPANIFNCHSIPNNVNIYL